MLPEFAVAVYLGGFLAVFSAVNLANVIRTMRRQGGGVRQQQSSEEQPNAFYLFLVVLGTVAFFVESSAYVIGVFSGAGEALQHWTFQGFLQGGVLIQLIGAAAVTVGGGVFLWSVLERGRSANVGRLVTWGAFRYVRHPSYVGYFLMFFGWMLLFLNPIALVPLAAIPGYVGLTGYEERLLVGEFGEEYVEYQRRTGRFWPKV